MWSVWNQNLQFFCPIDGWMEPLKALSSEISVVCKIVFQEEHNKFGICVKGGLRQENNSSEMSGLSKKVRIYLFLLFYFIF